VANYRIPRAAVTPTEKGVRVDLRAIYAYPDGHFNFVFGDGTNQPLEDALEATTWFGENVVRQAGRRAKEAHRG
jgi:hypothetical protein